MMATVSSLADPFPPTFGNFLLLFVCLLFVGVLLTGCDIFRRYDTAQSMWMATHREQKNFLATSNAKRTSLLLGPHQWTVHNDSKLCSIVSTYTTELKLTGCTEEDFTCGDIPSNIDGVTKPTFGPKTIGFKLR